MYRVLVLLAVVIHVHAGTIQGVVLEQSSGRPVARTVVRLDPVPKSGGGKVQPLATRAGRSGQFVFPAVAPGIYVLTAVREGYFPAGYGQRVPIGRGTPILVAEDSDLFAELRLRHKGALTGRVLDEKWGRQAWSLCSGLPRAAPAAIGRQRHIRRSRRIPHSRSRSGQILGSLRGPHAR